LRLFFGFKTFCVTFEVVTSTLVKELTDDESESELELPEDEDVEDDELGLEEEDDEDDEELLVLYCILLFFEDELFFFDFDSVFDLDLDLDFGLVTLELTWDLSDFKVSTKLFLLEVVDFEWIFGLEVFSVGGLFVMCEFVMNFEFVFDVFDTVVMKGSVELFLGDLDEYLLFSGDLLLLLDGEGLLVGLLDGLRVGLFDGLLVGLVSELTLEFTLVRLEATG